MYKCYLKNNRGVPRTGRSVKTYTLLWCPLTITGTKTGLNSISDDPQFGRSLGVPDVGQYPHCVKRVDAIC